MIPEFDERGYLPPGIHVASLEEVIERFGVQSEVRQAQAESLQWLMPLCNEAGIIRLLINGSFVTDGEEPNDVDCLLLQGPTYRSRSLSARQLRRGLPFLELKIVGQVDFDYFSKTVFASDREFVVKGVVEVTLD